MALTTYTIGKIAEMICGSHGTSDKFHWDNFIYRTYAEIQDFFISDCKLSLSGEYDGGSRYSYANDVLKEVNGDDTENFLSREIRIIISQLLLMVNIEKPESFLGAIRDINQILSHSSLKVEYDSENNKVQFIKTQDNQILHCDLDDFIPDENLFKKQFPAGLPFGIDKPHVKIFIAVFL
ncbi:MAG: hypothetical protein ACK5CA_12720 [Cyanobacteriota bacterium]|jgi:hypothetical protein